MKQEELIVRILEIEKQLNDTSLEIELLKRFDIPQPLEDVVHLIVNDDSSMTIYIEDLKLTSLAERLYLKLAHELGEEDILPVDNETSRGKSHYQITLLNDAPINLLETIQFGRKDFCSESSGRLPVIEEETECELAACRKM